MTGPGSDYIDITIDIFDAGKQRARVLRTLTAGELIAEILREFDDLDQDTPEGYCLYVKERSNPLTTALSLVDQDVQTYDELELRYARSVSGKIRLKTNERIFVIETSRPQLISLRWNPSIIGRATSDPAHNARLSIDLKDIQKSSYISRQHAQIVNTGGEYYLEGLSDSNPTCLNDTVLPVKGRALLHSGDQIILSNERIALIFVCLKPGEFDPKVPPAAVFLQASGGLRVFALTQVPYRIPAGTANSEMQITYSAEKDIFTLEQPPGEVKTVLIAGSPIPGLDAVFLR